MYRGVTWILGVRLCESASRQLQAASSFQQGLGAAGEGELLCLLIPGRVTSSTVAEIASETLDAKASPLFIFFPGTILDHNSTVSLFSWIPSLFPPERVLGSKK